MSHMKGETFKLRRATLTDVTALFGICYLEMFACDVELLERAENPF